jgi:hypothetical protein
MTRGLGIWKVSFPEIIFVLMDDQRSSEQILRLQMGNQIGIVGLFPYELNVSQIPCVPGYGGPGSTPVVARVSYVKMLAGP